MNRVSTSYRAAQNCVLTLAALATNAARRCFLSSLAVFFFVCASQSARASFISFSVTNYDGTPVTNDLILRPVGQPAVDAAGNITAALGLPIRIHLQADGRATNQLQQQNYFVTNSVGPNFLGKGFVFRAPLDIGPTVYPAAGPGQLISGLNYFVNLTSGTNGGAITFNSITNGLGFTPIGSAATNGFVDARVTNGPVTFTIAATNALYSDYTTKIAVLSALSMTNAFATNAAGVSLINNRLYISTNYDALGTALAIGLQSTNLMVSISNTLAGLSFTNAYGTNLATLLLAGQRLYVPTNFDAAGLAATVGSNLTNYANTLSNFLQVQITSGGINAGTATNIAAFQAQAVTNGFVDLRITNNAATKAFAQSLTNGFSPLVLTNVGQVVYTNMLPALTNRFALTNQYGNWNIFTNTFDPGDGDKEALTLSNNAVGSVVHIPNDVWLDNGLTVGAGIEGSGDLITSLNASQLTSGTVPLARLPAAVVTNGATGIAMTTLGVTNTFSVTNGSYLDLWFANGGFLRTNTAAPFDWEFHNTNGSISWGTNTTSKIIFNSTGLGFFQNVEMATLAAQSGKSNFVVIDSLGFFRTNDLNSFVASIISGTAGGNPPLTNAYGTNFPNGLVTGQRIYFPTNFDIAGGSNFLFTLQAGMSNWLQGSKLNATNDTSYGQTATNFTTMGNVFFGPSGQALGVYGASTQYLAFSNAGSSVTTNGALVWTVGLSVYTNWLNGGILTNNGSAWLMQTNGVTLYSRSGTSPVGTYSAINGALPAPTAFYTAAIGPQLVNLGYFSVSNINQLLTNVFLAATTNSIASLNGKGTNPVLFSPTLYSPVFSFLSVIGGTNNSVGAGPFDAIWGGSGNASAFGTMGITIVGGTNNAIFSPGIPPILSTIVGGALNKEGGSFDFIGGGFQNAITTFSDYATIAGGNSNLIGNGTSGTPLGTADVISGGQYNIIIPSGVGAVASTIPGGQSNVITRSYSLAAGHNATITNDGVLLFSDGTSVTSSVNAQAIFAVSNGAVFLVGGIQLTNFNTNVAVQALGVTTNGWLTTNGVPGGGGGGGSGTVTSVAATVPPGFSISGSPVTTSGTLAITRSGGNDNYLGGGATNIGLLDGTNAIIRGGITNNSLTASTLLEADANKKIVSIANPSVASVLTNLNGTMGYAPLLDASALKANQMVRTDTGTNLISTLDAGLLTNTLSWAGLTASTNFPVTFNGTPQLFTITNGPDNWITFAGANGSACFLIKTNCAIHLPGYDIPFLSGSNATAAHVFSYTNGVLSVTSFGGTNGLQMEVAGRENGS